MKRLFTLLCLISVFNTGCYVVRPLKEAKTIKIVDDFQVNVYTNFDSKYCSESDWTAYKKEFLNGIRGELSYYNESESVKPDYTLVINKFSVSEGSSTETISDATSPYNGRTYTLNSVDASCTFSLYAGDRASLIGEWTVSANKEEKITNNRNVGDLVFGTNKDNSEYRFKAMDDNIASQMSEKCGKRTCAKMTKKIAKNL